MNKLRPKFTLPELQEQLDGLGEGRCFRFQGGTMRAWFGASDVAATQLRNFAT